MVNLFNLNLTINIFVLTVFLSSCSGNGSNNLETPEIGHSDSAFYGVNIRYNELGEIQSQILLDEELDTLYEIQYVEGSISLEKGIRPWTGTIWTELTEDDSTIIAHGDYHFIIPDSLTEIEIRFMEWVDDASRYTTHVVIRSEHGSKNNYAKCQTKVINEEPLLRSVVRYFRTNPESGLIDTTMHVSRLFRIALELN